MTDPAIIHVYRCSNCQHEQTIESIDLDADCPECLGPDYEIELVEIDVLAEVVEFIAEMHDLILTGQMVEQRCPALRGRVMPQVTAAIDQAAVILGVWS